MQYKISKIQKLKLKASTGCLEKKKKGDAFHNSRSNEELPRLNYCVKVFRPLACQRPILWLACPGIEYYGKSVDEDWSCYSDNPLGSW